MKEFLSDLLVCMKHCGIAVLCFAPLVLIGIFIPSLVGMILVGGAGGAALGYFAGKDLKAVAAWGVMGAVAGLLFYVAV